MLLANNSCGSFIWGTDIHVGFFYFLFFKIPTTRAKSPNLGRRKSCSDTAKSSENGQATCRRLNRHSLGSYREDNQKVQINGRNGTSPKIGIKSTRTTPNVVSKKPAEQTNIDISAH